MDWKDTSRDKMEAVGCAGASITVKTELFLGLDEDVRTNWNRTSCLSRRICFSIQRFNDTLEMYRVARVALSLRALPSV